MGPVLQEQIKLSMGEEGPTEQRGEPFELCFGKQIGQKVLFGRLWQAQDKWFKRSAQHRRIFLAVVAELAFPYGIGRILFLW